MNHQGLFAVSVFLRALFHSVFRSLHRGPNSTLFARLGYWLSAIGYYARNLRFSPPFRPNKSVFIRVHPWFNSGCGSRSPALLLGLLLTLPAAARATVVINEIMYHPFHTAAQAEDTSLEWIELYNRGNTPINLAGWKLTRAVNYTFANVTLSPRQYLIIAANRASFLDAYPSLLTNYPALQVVGGWSGRLSNGDDEIELINPAGELVDAVEYADSGEWAVRARNSADTYGLRGWDWLAPHDGGGMTLELINSAMPNDYGQNWAASKLSGGTPGAPNSVFTGNTPPFLLDVTHFPLVPRSADPVTVTVKIEDEEPTGLTATLYYRNASSAFPPPFSPLTMFDDGAHGDGRAGDGIFGAVIPAQANLTVIEYYIFASDEDERYRTWPAPAYNAPDLGGGILPAENGANALYQVDNTVYTGTHPYYRIIMTEAERAFLASIAGSLRNSDASANATFLSIDPNGTSHHVRSSVRRRGAGSRGAPVQNLRVNFASDRRWKGVTAINLNSQYPHSQVAGSVLATMSGLQMAYEKPVQVRVNAVNLQGASSLTPYAQQEVPDGDYAQNHFPDDSNGNIYRASSGSHSATLAYLGTSPTSYINAGYSKTANGAEYDWSDLINLTDVLNNTPDANYAASVRQRLNVEQWMLYFAVFTMLDSKETSLGTGQGDDFALYRGLIDARFLLLAHDLDTILGQGDTAGNVNDSIFRATANPAIARFLRHPEFAPIYYRTLTNLMGTAFAPARLGAALDQHLGNWVAAGVIANMKTFAEARVAGVAAQIPLNLTASHSLPVFNGYARATAPTVTLFGNANAVATRSVTVDGTAAVWSAWNARWTNTVTLNPGINRILVQALGQDGREFEQTYVDIWYDTGSGTAVTSDISDDATWSPAEGVYTVSGAILVEGGSTLTIEPGTTVYFAPGASLTVAEGSRLVVNGTEANRVRFGRYPSTAGNWAGLVFQNSTTDNRLAYVDFDGINGSTIGGLTAQIHVNGSRVFFDHCQWSATPTVGFISFNASSFIVQDCFFPSYPGPSGAEMIHGINGIPTGGYGILRDNRFGRTWGYNDIVDFTGGNRPGPILQVIGNVFEGASDDHLDLDSADAWIEGNIFMHAHRDPTRTDDARDTASAISGGVDNAGQYPEWTIINNLFYDLDHVVLAKQGGRFIFVNNTVSHIHKENGAGLTNDISVFDWTDNGVSLPDPAIGAGAYVANNIIWDAPRITANYNPSNHTLVLENNLLPQAWTGPGSNNVVADPRLNLAAITNVLAATPDAVRAALVSSQGSLAHGKGYGNKYDRGGLNPPGLLVYGEPRGTSSVNSATLTVAPGGTFNWGTNAYAWGYTHYKWKLDNGPWSVERSITAEPTIALSNLANGAHTVYVAGRTDAGHYQDDTLVYPAGGNIPAHVTASTTWTVNTNGGRLLITEVLARNVAALPVAGRFPDAIELRNTSAKTIDLTDMSLSDDPAQPRKFVFPAGVILAPGSNLVIFAATGEGAGRIFTGFALNDSGDGVYLYDRLGTGGSLLDSVTFGLQLPDLSIGRMPDGAWGLCTPTLGNENIAQPLGDQRRLRINEWLAAAGTVLTADFIELYNLDSLPVSLGGLGLSDSPIGAPMRTVIPPLSFIAGRGWQAFICDGELSSGADHADFKLSADGGWIALSDTNGTFIDIVVYATQFPDVTQGRSPDGTDSFVSFNQPTPSAGNPAQTVVVTPITTTIVPLTQTWRMEASGLDLGTSWRTPGYDDSSWFSGQALFFADSDGANAPLPVNSVIPLTSPRQTTVYFRSTFNYTGPTNGLTFLLSHVVDDGCVVYLNNQEIYRYNFAAGVTITYSSRPSTVSGTPQVIAGIPVTLGNLLQGTNHIAVEVHQASSTSSDLSMAVALESQRYITNYLGIPVVLNEIFTRNRSYTNAAGKVVDWVELYNPSTNVIDISNMSLSDDPAQPRRWAFPDGALIAPGSFYVVEFDDSAPYTPFNAGFELSADSGAVYLFDKPTAGGSLIDSVVYGVQVADLSLGRAVPGPNATWSLGEPTRGEPNSVVLLGSASALRINEWMPNPDGEDDWFEIYNPGDHPVALGGLHLTDNLSNPIKHKIRPLTFIGGGADGYIKFIADSDVSKGADHVDFGLSNNGESLGLYTSNSVPTVIDSVSFGATQTGISQGRLPDGAATIVSFTNSVSPEEANWLPLRNVVISEVLSRPNWPMEQAIELANPTDVDVAIGGWFLSNARRDLKRYRLPAHAVVPAGGFHVLYEAVFNPSNDIPPSFALNGTDDDEVYLSEADANGVLTGYRATVSFDAAAQGISFSRYEKSNGADFVAALAPTFGVNNPATPQEFRSGAGAPNAYPVVGPIVINEIHYHPPDIGTNDNQLDEFIELMNISGAPAPLHDPAHPTNTWMLRDAVDFTFPAGVTIPAGGFVVVVSFNPASNPDAVAAFRAHYNLAPEVPLFGPFVGKLDNSTESIELIRPDSPVQAPAADEGRVPYILAERVKYEDAAPWPKAADASGSGVGISLQRRIAANYGNDPVNWAAGVPTPAAANNPGVNPPPAILSGPSNQVVTAGATVTLSATVSGSGPLTYRWFHNGYAIPNATNATLVLSNVQPIRAGLYHVVVANSWGAASSARARLTVQAPPQIVQQPQGRTAVMGSDVTFVVTASGASLNYQWRFFGTNLPGENTSSLTLNSIATANEGAYSVVISNPMGSVTSVLATLTVLVPPAIVSHPQSLTVVIGDDAGFLVSASGSTPLRYQWRLNGTNLSGATNTSLTVPNAQPVHSGDYAVVVTNAAGSITSLVATLTVRVPPTVSITATDPAAGEPADAGTFTFIRTGDVTSNLVVHYTVTGTATSGADYTPLSGAATIVAGSATATVLVSPINDSELEGDESVIVTLSAHADYLVAGSVAAVIIRDDDNAPPVISITAPANNQLFVLSPTNITLSVTVSDPNGSVARVEYFANGTNKVSEATGSPWSISWTNVPAGAYTLTARATDNLGATAVSAPVDIVVNAMPTVAIVSPVNNATFSSPASYSISAFASDADGSVTQVTFYANSTVIGADTSAPFTADVTSAVPGAYALRVVAFDNHGAAATSAVVNVTVNQPGIFDDFEPGVDLAQWFSFGGQLGTDIIANSNGGSVSGSRSLWFGGDLIRSATTRAIDASLGGSILFQLRLSSSSDSNWEQVDLPGEGVLLEYSINAGASWVTIATFDTPGANYTQGWTPLQFPIPGAAQTTNTMFRWIQPSHSGSCCDHWAIDDVQVLVGPTPPTIASQPAEQSAVVGGAASFSVTVFGSAPFAYQWRFNGTDLPGATNSTLALANVSTNQAGVYSVVVSNAYGSVTSSDAALTVIEAGSDYFRIVALTANSPVRIDHSTVTGDDRGGIALSSSQVFVTGDSATARFSAANLSGGVSLSTVYDGLVSDLRTETVYTLASAPPGGGTPVPISNSQGQVEVSHLLELNGNTGLLTGKSIPLSRRLELSYNSNNGFFAGYGRIVLLLNNRVYNIALPSGIVTDVGPLNTPPHTTSENWGFWGVAELTEQGLSLVYVRNSTSIGRTYVATGSNSVLATFSSLSDMASISVSVPRGRWYFHHEGSSQFGGSDESVGYASAQFSVSPGSSVSPQIVFPPVDTQTIEGGNVALSVSVIGSPSLNYQWRFNGDPIPGAIAPALTLFNVQPEHVGYYSLVVTNDFGAATSAPVLVSIALPPVITNQPVSQTVLAGATVSFIVGHSGDGPFTYEWFFDGNSILTTTSNTLLLSNVNFYYNGIFSVEVRNAVGVELSAGASLVVLSPPFFAGVLHDREVLRGMDVTLSTFVDGNQPIRLQWRKNGQDLPGQTNSSLILSNAQPATAGFYQLIATNIYGAVTGQVNLAVLELDADSFAVRRLSTNNVRTRDIYPVVSYPYQNGIAAGLHRVFVNGYGSGSGAAAAYDAVDLSGGNPLSQAGNGLVSDLKSRKVYSLATSSGLVGSGGGTVTRLIELDPVTGDITTNVIALSTNITVGYYSAIFSGWGRIVLIDPSDRVYDVVLPSGQVTYLGVQPYFQYAYAYGFAYRGWGLAERVGTNTWLVHIRDYQTIERVHVTSGVAEDVATFTSLGDYANFTASVTRGRWYLQHAYSSQFGTSSQNNLVSADASFVYLQPTNAAPAIVDQPADLRPLFATTARLSVFAEGTAPLSYRWWFNGEPLADAAVQPLNNSTITHSLTNVRSWAQGTYHLTLSNAFGAITSAPINLTVDYGASSSNTVNLFTLTGPSWRYNQTATFSTPSWTASNYNDSAWPAGRGLLAVENNASLTPLINTTLTLGRTTYYFRLAFNVTSNFPPGTMLRASTYIDDGAVIFLNGREMRRVRMTSGSYGPTTFANDQPPVNSDASQEQWFWPATNLVVGTNIIAAEIHQVSSGSSDIVWGMSLDAMVPVPNRPPVITTHPVSLASSNGGSAVFTVGAVGSPTLRYQWRHNGTNVPGGISSTLTINNLQSRHAGTYYAVVTNLYDTAVSSNATLTILVPEVRIDGGSVSFTAPGQFNLAFTANPGAVFTVERSTNLIHWIPAGSVTNNSGNAQFTDPNAGQEPYRFYRLRLEP